MKNINILIVILFAGILFAFMFTGCDPIEGTISEVRGKAEAASVKMVTVTFDMNGGEGVPPSAETKNAGSTIQLPDSNGFSRLRFAFSGWNTQSDGEGDPHNAGSYYIVPGKNVILYAVWNSAYIVTFDKNGGEGDPPAPQTVPVDEEITFPGGSGLSLANYTFIGWNTKEDGTGDDYTVDSSHVFNADITLYAKWKGIPCTVNFIANGPDNPPARTKDYGDLVEQPVISYPYHDFDGWYKEPGFENKWNFATDKVSGNMTLYAKWNIHKYKVTFISNGSDAVPEKTVDHGDTVNAPIPESRWGTFAGWYAIPQHSGGSPFNFSIPVTGNITLYARWNITTPFVALSELQSYLIAQSGGVSTGDALKVPINIDLGVMLAGDSGWRNLLNAIQNAGKFVSLDLSRCSMSGDEFNPNNNIPTPNGKDKIVAITFPDAALYLVSGSASNVPYSNFSVLREVKGNNIITIGAYSWYLPNYQNPYSLESAIFPAAKTVGESVFDQCERLYNVEMPSAETFGRQAFAYCSSLKSLNFPNAKNILDFVFVGCTALESISFPSTTTIDEYCPFLQCPLLLFILTDNAGTLSTIENGKALVRNGTELIAYPSAAGEFINYDITIIRTYAFSGNKTLERVYCPSVTSLPGYGAFASCTALRRVDLPNLTYLGYGNFSSNTALRYLDISKVTSLPLHFMNYSGTLSLDIYLRTNAPSIGGTTFQQIYENKDVTIHIISGATGYTPGDGLPYTYEKSDTTTKNWGNAFRGMGYDPGNASWTANGGYGTGTVNGNINLTIVESVW